MKKYKVSYWEKESVWVRRTVTVESEEKPNEENFDSLLGTADYEQADYDWNTAEHEEYDFENDFDVEEE